MRGAHFENIMKQTLAIRPVLNRMHQRRRKEKFAQI